MKFVLPGGHGQIGRVLVRALTAEGHECVILTRRPSVDAAPARAVAWDGRTMGPWAREIDGADGVINLAGRSVDCRYSEHNLREMMRSRVESTRLVGKAIAAARRPPRVWLQASTATIYAHRFDAANDERSGIIGGDEPGAPALWRRSVEIAQAWEAQLEAAATPFTRKVALRSAMVMGTGRGGVFRVLANLCRAGLGRHGDGRQYVSWIHADDFVAAIRFLIDHDALSGAVNLAAPAPLPNREFIAAIHAALGSRVSIPLPVWALEFGAVFLRTETELLLKSRRVVPARLQEAGFQFRHPEWPGAARDLVRRLRSHADC